MQRNNSLYNHFIGRFINLSSKCVLKEVFPSIKIIELDHSENVKSMEEGTGSQDHL